jgi:hypothetical protein
MREMMLYVRDATGPEQVQDWPTVEASEAVLV